MTSKPLDLPWAAPGAAATVPEVKLDRETVRELEPYLLGFARRAVQREDVAKDLVQQTYVAVLEAKNPFEGRSKLRTWMVGILVRKIVDFFRSRKRETLTDEVPETSVLDSFGPAPAVVSETRLDEQKALGVVERSLAELTELERTAVMLCDVEQVDRDVACNTMGVTPTHLRVLLHRGRHKLRRALEDAELQTYGA